MSTKILGLDIFEYHQHEAVSSTKLDTFHDSPIAYFEQFVTKVMPPKESWAFDFGQAHHCHMESADSFAAHVVEMQFPDFRTNKAKEWREAMKAARKLILTAEELAALRKMKAKIDAHPIAAQLLADTEAEVTFRRSFGKFTVQCRADRWSDRPREITLPGGQTLLLPSHFVDFKTTTSIAQFRKNWINFGYARQRCFYAECILSCLSCDNPIGDIARPEAFWIVSESEPPHECRVFSLGAESIHVARAEVMMDLKALRHCYESGEWQLPPEIETLEYPRWQVEQAAKRLETQRARLELTS